VKGPPVVYDTMVFLQVAVNPGRRYATFEAVQDKRLDLCTSEELLAEIRDVLMRPALARKFPALTSLRVAQFLDAVNALATSFPDVPRVFKWSQHPDDDHLFNLAIHVKAKYLVTWEKRILSLATEAGPVAVSLRQLAPNLAIITPSQLADLFRPPASPSTTNPT
jgi:putative PIN family toxin of toxin-antitoxin system